MKVEYSSNNSGGSWWLKKKDWLNLEKAGWTVEWKEDTFLGSDAMHCNKEFNTIREALEEFEEITGQDVGDNGCNCCGPPHSFSWDDEYASGSDLYPYLYGTQAKSLRDFYEGEK